MLFLEEGCVWMVNTQRGGVFGTCNIFNLKTSGNSSSCSSTHFVILIDIITNGKMSRYSVSVTHGNFCLCLNHNPANQMFFSSIFNLKQVIPGTLENSSRQQLWSPLYKEESPVSHSRRLFLWHGSDCGSDCHASFGFCPFSEFYWKLNINYVN